MCRNKQYLESLEHPQLLLTVLSATLVYLGYAVWKYHLEVWLFNNLWFATCPVNHMALYLLSH